MTAFLSAATDRAAWLEARREGIGCSELAPIFDFMFPPEDPAAPALDPHRTALDIYLDKIGAGKDTEPSPAMEWGNDAEPAIGANYTRRTGRVLIPMQYQSLVHPHCPHLRGTPDFLVRDEPGIVECKNVGRWMAAAWDHEAQVAPFAYLLQCQGQLGVTSREWCDLSAAIAGEPPADWRILPDAELHGGIIEMVEKFWRDYVEKRVPPISTHVYPTDSQIKRLYRVGSPDTVITATDEIELLMLERIDAKTEELAAEKRVKELDAPLKLYMGEATRCDGRAAFATWKNDKASPKVDHEAAARHLWEDAHEGRPIMPLEWYEQQHTTIVPGARKLLVKPAKGEK